MTVKKISVGGKEYVLRTEKDPKDSRAYEVVVERPDGRTGGMKVLAMGGRSSS